MNNTTLMSADRNTHVKIVAVSLVAAILVVGIGIAARSGTAETGFTAASGRTQANGPVIRAGKPLMTTSSDTTAIR